MINIKLICLGKIKEKYLSDAINEYSKRLSRFCKLDIIELPDEKLPTSLTDGNIQIIKDKEGDLILNKAMTHNNAYIMSLDENGEEFSSTEFAKVISNIEQTNSTIVIMIGGSLGLSEKVLKISNKSISFSKMTFPHQLFRVFVLEQLFRSFKILSNEQYHH